MFYIQHALLGSATNQRLASLAISFRAAVVTLTLRKDRGYESTLGLASSGSYQEPPSLVTVVVCVKHAAAVANPAVPAVNPTKPRRGLRFCGHSRFLAVHGKATCTACVDTGNPLRSRLGVCGVDFPFPYQGADLCKGQSLIFCLRSRTLSRRSQSSPLPLM